MARNDSAASSPRHRVPHRMLRSLDERRNVNEFVMVDGDDNDRCDDACGIARFSLYLLISAAAYVGGLRLIMRPAGFSDVAEQRRI